MNGTLAHRHGPLTHGHHHHGPHRHAWLPIRSDEPSHHGHGSHGHSHGLVDASIVRSRAGVRVVLASLAVLAVTAVLQAIVYVRSGSVALMADLIHNGGDALTALPLGFAFVTRNRDDERRAGYVVVAVIFISACTAGYEVIDRLVHPRDLDHLAAVAVAGLIGFLGNEIAARLRLRGGTRLDSPALIADGQHARTDGYVSLAVVASAVAAAVGYPRVDPVIGLVITGIILRVTWQAWNTVRSSR